ncbi:hypothetical protein GCK32_013953 [Trichostrongylus colubriformis]|uniref:Uncharacterized protein n=1 Tax=Trichostrongylus colubriformis TaxID=6319 RepID=A0AAN8IS71_TRICO
MVQNDKFLSDPAALDHICYMNATDPGFYLWKVTSPALTSELSFLCLRLWFPKKKGCLNVIEAETDFHPKYDSAISDEGTFVNSTSNSPNHGRTSQASKDFHYQEIYRPIKEDAHSMMPRQCKEELQSSLPPQPKDECQSNRPPPKDELQTSEQEPSEPQSSATLRNEVCLESIKMALESIPPANRQKAHVDILRYVYTTIFDKYLL